MPNYFVHTLLRARDWQQRAQFDEVCQWWRSGGRGVLALVGMGGAGKTAIAERFLRILPGGLPDDPDISTDDTLLPPSSVFVFSFYDAPNPEAFFHALQMWLEQTPHLEKVLSLQQLLFKLQNASGLLVLDGLEKVQEDGLRGLLGELSSPNLREFLDRIASGYCSGLSVLITSRFPLADLRDARPQFFRLLAVEEIDLRTGIKLLQARGVQGNERKLGEIVDACGRHALTVDFAGGYITEFADGDPNTPLEFKMDSDQLRRKLEEEPDEARRHVLKQGHRFARLAERYRDAIIGNTSEGSQGDAAALALLERICLFRLGVDAETLANIFTGENAVRISGLALASLDKNQLQKKLDWLVRMRVVESQIKGFDSESKIRYSVHPAVRDGFLSGFSTNDLQLNHEAVRRGIEVSLGGVPGAKNYPSDNRTLDLLEEIVFHTLEANKPAHALNIYQNSLGGCRNLIARLNDYQRSVRIAKSIFAKFIGNTLPIHDSIVLHNDIGFSYLQLGCIYEALDLLSKGFDLSCQANNSNLATLGNNLAIAQKLAGRLGPALKTWKLVADNAHDSESRLDAVVEINKLERLRGHLSRELYSPFDISDQLTFSDYAQKNLAVFTEYPPVYFVQDYGEYKALISSLETQYPEGIFELACVLLTFAEMLVQISDLASPTELVRGAWDWAIAHDAKEILCWCSLIQARIAISAFRCEKPELDSPPNELRSSISGDGQSEPLQEPMTSISRGLKIARDCGYGLYHIDLLLARARLHLLGGDSQAALEDVRLALDDGLPADEQTGQPELLAANHPDCGYAWAIAEGLQLRGEALLLQAAQVNDSRFTEPCLQCGRQRDNRDHDRAICDECSSDQGKFSDLAVAMEADGDSPSRIKQWNVIRHWLQAIFGKDVSDRELWSRCKAWLEAEHKFKPNEYLQFSLDGFIKFLEQRRPTPEQESIRGIADLIRRKDELLCQSRSLVVQAKECLNQAMERWQPLHDPEPERIDQNFQLDGKQYNYRAAETYQVLRTLEGGVLTNFRIVPNRSTTNRSRNHMEIVTDPVLRNDELWIALDRAIRKIQEEKQVLWEKKPEWDQGLNSTRINQLCEVVRISVRPVFETPPPIFEGVAEMRRLLKIHHPDIDDPVELCVWMRNGAVDISDAKIERVVAYLKAWQNKRSNQLRVTNATPETILRETGYSVKRFSVALSFPGEHRDFASEVAEELSLRFGKNRILYDKYHEAEFARINLDIYLPKLYREESELVVLFLCPEYQTKRWPKLEWRHVRQLITTANEDSIMLTSFGSPGDLSEVGILQGDGYVDIGNREPKSIANLILDRYKITMSGRPSS